MSHPIIAPVVPLTLDRPRTLKMDFNALAYLEEHAGFSIMSPEMWANLKMKVVRIVVTAALRHEDSSLTPEIVGKLLHMGNLQVVMKAVGDAWKLSMGTEDAPLRPLEMRPEPATPALLPVS